MTRSVPLAVAACCLTASIVLSAQSSPSPITIDSPVEGAYVSGLILLSAIVDPSAGPVTRLTFFANGKVVCTLEEPPFRCEWDAGVGINAHQIRVVAQLADSRRVVQNARTKKAGFAEAVQVDVVQVTATVTDGQGRFVKGLTEDAFRVYEDRVPQRISHFASENVPLEVVVAVDISGSMTDAMPAVRSAVKTFLSSLQPTDQVTLIGFNNDILTLANRSASPALRIRAVDRLRPWGGTALYDVIVRSLDQLGRTPGRKAVVIFSDGDDQSSHVTIEDVERRVDASDATLYLIGQGRATSSRSLQTILERLAQVSGGRALFIEGTNRLNQTFNEIVAELSNQYLLAYPPTNAKHDDAWRQIDVELTNTEHKVRARRGYRTMLKPGQD